MYSDEDMDEEDYGQEYEVSIKKQASTKRQAETDLIKLA